MYGSKKKIYLTICSVYRYLYHQAGVPKASSKIASVESRIGRFLARVKTIGYNRFSLAQRKRPVKLNGHSLLNHILISPHLSSAKKILYSI